MVFDMTTIQRSAASIERERFSRGFGGGDLVDSQGRRVCSYGHLVCEGGMCGNSCACANEDETGDFSIRVRTDKDGDTLCKECRYETKTAAWNQ